MAEAITILGSTGSIGTQALEVAAHLGIRVLGLAAGKNIGLLREQIIEFSPRAVSVIEERDAELLRDSLSGSARNIKIYTGDEGACAIAAIDGADTALCAMSGISGLFPVIEAIRSGKDIALANKEVLVAAGAVVTAMAEKNNVKIIPVDSEHSAIMQCLGGRPGPCVHGLKKIILTASGGPFRGVPADKQRDISREEALRHPSWKMGEKVTIDSATLMNKGFEVIEAKWLFGMDARDIEVVIHPQSIVHSMVAFRDGSVIAQLGMPDMRIPIQYALTFPERAESGISAPDFAELGTLTFEKPDMDSFPCLGMAYEAISAGGIMPAVLNAADETAVRYFLEGKAGFTDISLAIRVTMNRFACEGNNLTEPCLNDMVDAGKQAAAYAGEFLEKNACTGGKD